MPRRRHATWMLVALSALTACSAGPSTRPVIAVHGDGEEPSSVSVPSGPREVPPLESYETPGLSWTSCTDSARARMGASAPAGTWDYECAQVTVRLDTPSRPGRGNLGMSLLRVGTGGSPLVVVGEAGGEPGTLKAARLAANLPASVLSTFTLIGVDRRGTGESDPVQCVPDEAREGIVEADPGAESHEKLAEAYTKASHECVLDMENRLPAVDSWRASADLEQLREELGVPHLNAIGVGEGSRVLSLYASRYPDRIGRVVFDGAPDPTLDVSAVLQTRAVAAEEAFSAFQKDCVVRGCPLGADATDRFKALLNSLRDKPLRGGDFDLTPGTATEAVLAGLADRPRWSALADAIVAAEGGDGTKLSTFIEPLVVGQDDDPPRLDAGIVTACNDTTTRIPPERVAGMAADWRTKQPLFGAYFARKLLACGPFPVPQAVKVPRLVGAPPVLVLTTAADPVTPREGSERAAQALPAGVVVGWQGGGHGALGQSACATKAAEEFLVSAKVPSSGTVCPP
ncbi:alpha/beta fold hydrolase [Actinosynnema sp. NPDC050801]|uniref:alpha/beta fold hydrolase n=1 Tax=unclassified Actinosynnema TaxID=2637065 RepID=UPI0033F19D20